MHESIVLPMLLALISTSACRDHVCVAEPGRCDDTVVSVEPSRIALGPEPIANGLQLHVRFAGDSLATSSRVKVTQAKGPSFAAALGQTSSDPHNYIVDLSPYSTLLTPGKLTIELPNSFPVSTLIYDSAPFSSVKPVVVPTTNLRGYQRTASYSLLVAGPTSDTEAATARYLISFGAIQTPPNDVTQSIKYTLDLGSSTVLDPARTMMSSYAYNSQPNLWLGNAVYNSSSKKLWFYYAQATVFTDAYKLIRCPDTGNTPINCVTNGGQTGVSSGLSGPGREAFQSMAVDAEGHLAILTNDTTQEAYQFTEGQFKRIPIRPGIRIRQLAVTSATAAIPEFPDIFAVSEDNILLRYKFDPVSAAYFSPVSLYDLKLIFPGEDVASLAVGDINGDDLSDIVVADNKSIIFLINNGSLPSTELTLEKAQYSLVSSSLALKIRTLTISDVDGDGRQDIIAGSDAGLDAKVSASSVVEFFLSNRPQTKSPAGLVREPSW